VSVSTSRKNKSKYGLFRSYRVAVVVWLKEGFHSVQNVQKAWEVISLFQINSKKPKVTLSQLWIELAEFIEALTVAIALEENVFGTTFAIQNLGFENIDALVITASLPKTIKK